MCPHVPFLFSAVLEINGSIAIQYYIWCKGSVGAEPPLDEVAPEGQECSDFRGRSCTANRLL